MCDEVQDYFVKDAGLLIAHEVRDGRDDPQAAGGDTAGERVDDPARVGHPALGADH